MEVILFLFVCGVLYVFWPKQTKRNLPRQEPRVTGNVASPSSGRSTTKPLYLPPIPPSLIISGKAHIIDGDTIRIGRTKIRLAGIDAPEIDMPWGQKSKWAMVGICKGQVITARLDGERSFDRLVATCFLPDGRDIGVEIIKEGLALDLPHFSGGKYRQFEPEGARKKLCNGRFGHSSIKSSQYAQAYKRNNH